MYAVFSCGILALFFYVFLLTEFLYLVNPNDQKVWRIKVHIFHQSWYINTNRLKYFVGMTVGIQKLQDVSDAFFLSVTGYKMAIKIHYFLQQRREYRALVNEFQYSKALRPHNEEEEKYICSLCNPVINLCTFNEKNWIKFSGVSWNPFNCQPLFSRYFIFLHTGQLVFGRCYRSIAI